MHRIASAAALAAFFIALTAFAEGGRIPNSVKYRDSSTEPARGRSGNASIEARALAGRDGVTILDVTTGSFDTAGPGHLEKVQVKIPAADELTFNYNGLSATAFSTQLPSLVPGDALQVQASVGGVDGERTGVVTADLTVRRRPDLEVSMLTAPPHGVVDMPLRVTALVAETNGDSGARADCVLYSGEVELRRAHGIWVDAGGSVTCSFAWPFDSAGVKPLRVAVEHVSPADDDPSDDAATGETRIYDRADAIPQWNTSAHEFEDRSWQRTSSATSAHYRENDETRQISTFSGMIRGPLNIQTVRVTSTVLTDGELLYDGDEIEADPFTFPPFLGGGGGASLRGDGFDGFMIYRGSGVNQTTSIDIRRVGGEVTYHDEGFDLSSGQYYTWNESGSLSRGTVARPYGSTVSMTVAVSDGVTLWEGRDSHMLLQAYSSIEDIGPICFDHPGYGEICQEWSTRQFGRYAYDDQTRH